MAWETGIRKQVVSFSEDILSLSVVNDRMMWSTSTTVYLKDLLSDRDVDAEPQVVMDDLKGVENLAVHYWPRPQGLGFEAINKYTEMGREAVYNDYYWAYGPIVEPHVPTTLRVQEARPGHSYTWTWEGHVYYGTSLPVFVKEADSEPAVVLTELGPNKEITRQLHTALTVKYVRREMRTLDEEDREAFFHALETMHRVDIEKGANMFGPDYRDMNTIIAVHTNLAVGEVCDHMHNGLGFLNQHLGLTMEFERSLQSVNPRVSVPYWDFTIDAYNANKYYDGNPAAIWKSIMFDPDWFGTVDEVTNTITEGRWKGLLQVPRVRSDSEIQNSYGLMRSPWNNNPVPYVQRFPTLAGEHKLEPLHTGFTNAWPACEVHWDHLHTQDKSYYEYVQYISGPPHGTVHTSISGNYHGQEAFEAMDDLLDPYMSHRLKTLSNIFLRDMYKWGLLTCPEKCEPETPYEECMCSCGDEAELRKRLDDPKEFDNFMAGLTDYPGRWSLFNEDSWGSTEELDRQNKKEFFVQLCGSGLYVGEQAESSSPADIIFWTIHPGIDHLTHWFLLNKEWKDPTWSTENHYWYTSIDECYGHGPYDVLQWTLPGSTKTYSNLEWIALSNPGPAGAYALPFVYDSFAWSHCLEEGYDFSAI
uniref:Tyrosinase copper-binding domain-containing protein n=1 Tax=Fibrocapsa japonica TaxID=94617 RepID=A0A7S2XX74_9STRA